MNIDGRFTEDEPRTWQAHVGNVYSLAWSADGSGLVSTGDDGKIIRWTIGDEPTVTRIQIENPGIGDFALFPGGSLFARAGGKGLAIWDWRTGKAVADVDPRHWVSVATSADGQTFAGWNQSWTNMRTVYYYENEAGR